MPPTDTDVMAIPMIFLRTGGMKFYDGLTDDDQLYGGGDFVAKHGYGHEIFNFRPFEGRVYGYVQPKGTTYNGQAGPGINIGKLGAPIEADSIDNALVIWVAPEPKGGVYIVGWYKNATIYRKWQEPPPGSNRTYNGEGFGFYATSRSEDATLLPRPPVRFRFSK